MRVYEAIADALLQEGVTQIFGLMGDGNMSLWSTLVAGKGAQILAARHEAGAVAMADGYFRASGSPGVATVTCGPGLTQIGTSLMAAARNRSAIVVVCGEIAPSAINTLQTMDQRRFVEACETRYISILGHTDPARKVMEAFYIARRESRPVVLNLPNDDQERMLQTEWRYRPSRDFLPETGSNPAAEEVEVLSQALMASRRPLFISGRGARTAEANAVIVELAGRAGALLGTTLQAKGFFRDQEWSVGIIGGYASAATERLCREADLVVGIGAEIGHYTSWGGTLFPDARIIRIDSGRQVDAPPVMPMTVISADAAKTIRLVRDQLSERQFRSEGWRSQETAERLGAKPEPLPSARRDVDPRRLAFAIGEAMEPGMRLICGVGHFQGFVASYVRMPEGSVAEFSSQFGAVGQTLPIAIGISAADPSRRHLCIEGDGSLWMNLQELDTVVRSRAPLTLLVWNDGGYGAEFQRLPLKGFSPSTAQWERADFAGVAKALGGEGATVTRMEDFPLVWRQAQGARGLFVIDAHVSPHEASDSYRKLYWGEPNRTPLLR